MRAAIMSAYASHDPTEAVWLTHCLLWDIPLLVNIVPTKATAANALGNFSTPHPSAGARAARCRIMGLADLLIASSLLLVKATASTLMTWTLISFSCRSQQGVGRFSDFYVRS